MAGREPNLVYPVKCGGLLVTLRDRHTRGLPVRPQGHQKRHVSKGRNPGGQAAPGALNLTPTGFSAIGHKALRPRALPTL
eukprot:6102263-Prymnesium_polylepis.1